VPAPVLTLTLVSFTIDFVITAACDFIGLKNGDKQNKTTNINTLKIL